MHVGTLCRDIEVRGLLGYFDGALSVLRVAPRWSMVEEHRGSMRSAQYMENKRCLVE